MKVLVAEDNEAENKLYRVALEARGHKVEITRNGRDCVKAYKDELAEAGSKNDPFDVVILDYAMPEMDGLEAAKEIVALRKNQRLIFVSAYVREMMRASVEQLQQVVSIIQKPFEPHVLVSVIEDIATVKELVEINKVLAEAHRNAPTDVQITELLAILKRIQKIGLS